MDKPIKKKINFPHVNMSIPLVVSEHLIKIYCPLFCFSKNERYFPSSVEFFISRSKSLACINEETKHGFNKLLESPADAPVYYNIQDHYADYYSINYLLFFPCSVETLLFGCWEVDNIFGSFARVSLFINKKSCEIHRIQLTNDTNEPVTYFPLEFSFQDKRPVVYISEKSHEMKPFLNCQQTCSSFWNPQHLALIDRETKWIEELETITQKNVWFSLGFYQCQ